MSLGNRVQEAIAKTASDDLENALIQISIAIDKTGKKRRPKEGKGQRYKGFIRDHESFIIFLILGLKIATSPAMIFQDRYGNEVDIAHIYYKAIRNALLHDGEIDTANIAITDENLIGSDKDNRVLLSKNILWALILVVICDLVNTDEKMDGCHKISLYGHFEIHLCDMWGKMDELHQVSGYNDV